MIGMTLTHVSGIAGTVDATTVHGDGKAYARINDHWLPVDELHGE